jgi:hypothetical protein
VTVVSAQLGFTVPFRVAVLAVRLVAAALVATGAAITCVWKLRTMPLAASVAFSPEAWK